MSCEGVGEQRVASDRSRTDRVIGVVDCFQFVGLGVGSVCESMLVRRVPCAWQWVASMARVRLGASRRHPVSP